MKTSSVLKHAKVHLRTSVPAMSEYGSSRSTYICLALRASSELGDITQRDAARVQKIVAGRLGRYVCVEDWLRSKGVRVPNPPHESCATATHARYRAFLTKVQTHRHAWVDRMIAEFATKGD